ncbi:hypothetical protein H8D36_00915 [archaeon]|nr:hypothetical protein [archaeon]MBL7056683.1 hypothetical protein [Candidatus Woesearchaeota archaeon]
MSECLICEEVITNPVCTECLQKEMETWLYETRPDLMEELQNRSFELFFDRGNTNCLVCKTEMSICPYCFTDHIRSWVIEKCPELLDKFNIFFNFHYAQESWIC